MQPCDCCEGTDSIVPLPVLNQPGLETIRYRIGTFATFRESMIARLNRICAGEPPECESGEGPFPLRDRLKTRSLNDPSLALLDAWAAVADVLTLYQDRIANEGYLSTATRPRSLHELSRLVGYRPRPGLSSSGLVAFEVEEPETQNGADAIEALPRGGVLIPKGAAVESTPAAGTTEEPQTFETTDDFIAFQAWNNIALRKTRPQRINPRFLDRLYLKGLGLGLTEGDYLYATVGAGWAFYVHRITKITENPELEFTLVEFTPPPLSARRLIETLRRIIESFPGTLPVNDAPLISTGQPHFADVAKKRLNVLFDASTPKHFSIARIDAYFCNKIVNAQVGLLAKGNDDAVVSVVEKLLEWSQKLAEWAGQPGGAFRDELLTEPYKQQLAEIIQRYHLQHDEIVQRHLDAAIDDRTQLLHQTEKTVSELTDQLDSAVIVSANPQPVLVPDGAPLTLSAISRVFVGPGFRLAVGPGAPPMPCFIVEIVERNVAGGELIFPAVGIWNTTGSTTQRVIARHANPTNADIESLLAGIQFQSTVAGAWQIELRYEAPEGVVYGFASLYVYKGGPPPAFWNQTRPALQIQVVGKSTQPLASFPKPAGFDSVASTWKIFKSGEELQPLPNTRTFDEVQQLAVQLNNEPGLRIFQMRNTLADGQSWRMYVPVIGAQQTPRVFKPPQALRALPERTLELHQAITAAPEPIRNLAANYLLDVGPPLVYDTLAKFVLELKASGLLPLLRSAAAQKDFVLQSTMRMANPSSAAPPPTAQKRLEELMTRLDPVDTQTRVRLRQSIVNIVSEPRYELYSAQLRNEVDKLRERTRSSSTLAHAATFVEDFETDLSLAAQEIRARYTQLRTAVQNVHDAVLAALRDVRVEFLTAVRTAIARHEPLGPSSGVRLSEADIQDYLKRLRESNQLWHRTYRTRWYARLVTKKRLKPDSVRDGLSAELRELVMRVDPPPQTAIQTNQSVLGDLLGGFPDLSASVQRQLDLVAAQGDEVDPHNVKQLLARLATARGAKERRFLFDLLRNERVTDPELEPKVFVLPTQVNVFGWNAPPKDPDVSDVRVETFREKMMKGMPTEAKVPVQVYHPGFWPPFYDTAIDVSGYFINLVNQQLIENIKAFLRKKKHRPTRDAGDAPDKLFLDGEFRNIKPGDLIAIRKLPYAIAADGPSVEDPSTFVVKDVRIRPRTAYSLRGNTTEVFLDRSWWTPFGPDGKPLLTAFEDVTRTRVFCEARQLTLAEEPFEQPSRDVLICDTIVDNLEPGQQLAIIGTPEFESAPSATRTDSELVAIRSITHEIDPTLHNDRYVTHIRLTQPLVQHRAKGQIMANLVPVTHGKTVEESVGGGQGDKSFLKHQLQEAPLSRFPSRNSTGVRTELDVYVNDVRWKQSNSFEETDDRPQRYVAQQDFTQAVTLVFGDGVVAARPPTGLENIKAKYRVGLGIAGNVAEGRIDQVSGSPIGVTRVVNPLPADGGADPDGPQDTRDRAPLSVMAFDRLVSVTDYRDFALSYAGIGKVAAIRLFNVIYVTIAATHPGPTPNTSQIYLNLQAAISNSGAAKQRFRILDRDISFLVIFAKVQIDEWSQWETVEKSIRKELFHFYSYDRAQFAATLYLSDATRLIQSVSGVVHVRFTAFNKLEDEQLGSISPAALNEVHSKITLRNARFAKGPVLLPAELCFLNPQAPGTLVLEEFRNAG